MSYWLLSFDRVYDRGLELSGTNPKPFRRRDRFRSLVVLLRRAPAGCVAECGCFRGLSSYILTHYARGRYRVFDSFEGLSEPGPEDEKHSSSWKGNFACGLEKVREILPKHVEFFKGWIPQCFPQDEQTYAFVHIDVDLYQPTKDSLLYFWPRMVQKGIIVCDDYNWKGARQAVDEFCQETGARLKTTENQQAYIVKP